MQLRTYVYIEEELDMKIVNISKFVRSLILILGIAITISLFSMNTISLSHQEVQYKEIYASTGDTLWSLAKQEAENNLYYENKDIRYVIKDIQKINDLTNSSITTGQKLKIPEI